jgi:serine/threonine protein kinase
LIGRELHGYRVARVIGHGGMGAVFLATPVRLDRPVALKVLPPALVSQRHLIERFEQEARAIARLHHPAIVQVHDMFEAEGLYVIAMEYLAGGSLRGLVKRAGPLPEERAATLASDAALGLWAAAEAGIFHRDVKPDNVLLSERGEAKVVDLGLARMGEQPQELTRDGTVVGTPPYMPPEQWKDSHLADHRSDLYALGCTLYQMLTGEPPFPGPAPYNFMNQHLTAAPPDPRMRRPELSDAMRWIALQLLAKDPADRFQTGAELARALAPLTGVESVPTLQRPSGLRTPPPGTAEMPAAHARPRRVREVDDEESIRRSLSYALQREGCDVQAAQDGDVGLERLKSFEADLVILDVDMPRVNGFEVLKRLRGDGNRVPVIMLTGEVQEADKVQGLDLGADDDVTKPYGLAELHARVRARLRRP